MSNRSTKENPIFPILLVNFIGSLGFSVVLPFLVVLVLKFGGNQVIYGIMGATYSLFQLIGAPILGEWSDRFGRRKILVLSQAGTFFAWVIFMVALSVPNSNFANVESNLLGTFSITLPLILLFLARALDGLTGGNVSVANAYLADISTDENRKTNFGKMSASANLGFIIGPGLAGLLGSTIVGDALPVGVAMLISLVAIALIQFGLPESNQNVESQNDTNDNHSKNFKTHKKGNNKTRHNLGQALGQKGIKFMLVLYFIIFLSFNFFYVAFPVHSVQALEWNIFELGLFLSILSGLMVIVQGPILGFLSSRVSERPLIFVGNGLLAICFYCFTSPDIRILSIGLVCFAIGNGIMWPSFMAILSQIAGSTHQGTIQGFAGSMGSLASIIGLLAGGVLYEILNAWTFLIPSILMLGLSIMTLVALPTGNSSQEIRKST